MATLHLRNVPPEVIARLEVIAVAERSSVSAVAVRELDMLSRRADNARLLNKLPDTDVSTDVLLTHLDAGRDER
ncbi:antitoxin [Geodermatophilaceae bacterium NBWT11]|nr:antitoxin [Geodermatophilaceae bacterium NBWT11]